MAPNFISVRLLDDDKDLFVAVLEAAEQEVGLRLSTTDIYRLAIKALAYKYGIET